MSSEEKPLIPNNFRSLVRDFTNDLTTVFPEYDFYWAQWGADHTTDQELKTLLDYCSKVYPERFFDILYQNEDIFKKDSGVNTYFLPKMSFELLFNCEGVSENSKKIMWKYLQLMLFTVVGSIDDKKSFGESMNMFEGIDENMLQEKMEETMKNISEAFENMSSTTEGEKSENNKETNQENMQEEMNNAFRNMPNVEGMPNLENLQSHLKKLFDGKIGKLAKELAEEVADEFKESIGDLNNANPQDMIKKLMSNPNKIKNLMKTVSGRLDEKMKSGEISKEDIMKEAGDFLNEVKRTGGDAGVNEMLKNVMKSMGGLGKNAKINKGALNRMMKQSENRERILKKAEARKREINKKKEEEKQQLFERKREQNRLRQQYSLEQKENPDNLVFKIEGEEDQEKSFIHPDIVKELLEEEDKEKASAAAAKEGSKKKKKKKKKA
jgi:hypothetical protein